MANRPLFRGPRVPERCVAISKPSNEGTNMWNRTTEEEAFIVVVVVVVVVFVVVAVVVVLLPGSPGPATGADSAAGAAGFESGGRFSASPLSRRRRTARSLARSARARGVRRRRGPTATKASSKVTSDYFIVVICEDAPRPRRRRRSRATSAFRRSEPSTRAASK